MGEQFLSRQALPKQKQKKRLCFLSFFLVCCVLCFFSMHMYTYSLFNNKIFLSTRCWSAFGLTTDVCGVLIKCYLLFLFCFVLFAYFGTFFLLFKIKKNQKQWRKPFVALTAVENLFEKKRARVFNTVHYKKTIDDFYSVPFSLFLSIYLSVCDISQTAGWCYAHQFKPKKKHSNLLTHTHRERNGKKFFWCILSYHMDVEHNATPLFWISSFSIVTKKSYRAKRMLAQLEEKTTYMQWRFNRTENVVITFTQ